MLFISAKNSEGIFSSEQIGTFLLNSKILQIKGTDSNVSLFSITLDFKVCFQI